MCNVPDNVLFYCMSSFNEENKEECEDYWKINNWGGEYMNDFVVNMVLVFAISFILGYFIGMFEGYKICRDEGEEDGDN